MKSNLCLSLCIYAFIYVYAEQIEFSLRNFVFCLLSFVFWFLILDIGIIIMFDNYIGITCSNEFRVFVFTQKN